MSKDVLRQLFFDICRGFSEAKIRGKTAFIKHVTFADQIGFEAIEKQEFERAKSEGLPTLEDRLAKLKEDGDWTDKNEKELKDIKAYIDSMNIGKKNIMRPADLQAVEKQIKDEEDKYHKKLNEKYQLIGMTCENYAQRIVEEYSVYKQLYVDSNFQRQLYSEEEFSEFSEEDIREMIIGYNTHAAHLCDLNIKRLAIQDFFNSYYNISSDNFTDFFGIPTCKFSYFQLKLANYAKYYKSILETLDTKNAPQNILDDPDKLVDWAIAVQRGKKEIEKGSNAAIGGMGGMSAQDRKTLGVADDSIDLAKEAAKHGGKLNMNQLMKAFGKA